MAATEGSTFFYKGVEYEFIDETKKNLEDLVCPICQEILNDPSQTNCGHLFCGRCLQQSASRVKNCPVCREEYTSMSDQFLTRKINGLKVKCSNAGKGCEWSGELRDAEGHVKTASCQYAEVLCKNGCGEYFQQRLITAHEKWCRKRHYSCTHCRMEATFDEITTSHYTLCESYPLSCPNGCSVQVVRNTLSSHLIVCPRRLVKCRYRLIGCPAVLEVKDMEKHLEEKKDQHLEMSMDTVIKLSVCMGQLHASLHPAQVPAGLVLPHQRTWLENDGTFPLTPWVVKFEGYEVMKALDMAWYSDPIFTHSGGYTMCLEVHANGFSTAKGKYLSVYICLRQGEMDDVLKWPFTGKLRFTLLNQVEDNNHLRHTKCSVDYPTQLTRVLPPRRRSSGLGSRSFIELLSLRDPSQPTIQYLQDDCLYVKVETLSVT